MQLKSVIRFPILKSDFSSSNFNLPSLKFNQAILFKFRKQPDNRFGGGAHHIGQFFPG